MSTLSSFKKTAFFKEKKIYRFFKEENKCRLLCVYNKKRKTNRSLVKYIYFRYNFHLGGHNITNFPKYF